MNVTIIIPTHNRCRSLSQILQDVCGLVMPNGITWEMIVVDNGSTDATRQVCAEFQSRLPIRCVPEPILGVACATNRGIREAKGDLILFTDDDVILDKHWLTSYWNAAARHPESDFFGGKSIPHWDASPPCWLVENLDWLLHITRLDKGDVELYWEEKSNGTFLGHNMAYRRRIFEAGFRFNEQFGIRGCGTERIWGHEGELQRRLARNGSRGLYVPAAIVYHHIKKEEITEKALRRYYAGFGACEVRFGSPTKARLWFGASVKNWRKLSLNVLRYLTTRWTRPARIWLHAEIEMATTWGEICERRRQRSMQSVRETDSTKKPVQKTFCILV